MKYFKLKFVLLVIVAIVFSSCTHRVFDFTLISSKNVDLSKGATFEKGKQRVEGIDLAHWIIVFPTGSVNIKEALDKAIESTPGCVALLDGVVFSKFWWIPYIYGQQSIIIEGTPLIDPSLASNYNNTPKFEKIEMDKNGEIKSVEKISTNEYLALKGKIVKEAEQTKFEKSGDIN